MSKINNITGQWLDSYRWSYFLTLTTRYELTLKSARRLSAVFYNKVNEISVLNRQNETAFVYFIEAFENKPGYHLHALLHANITIKQLYETWQAVTNAKEEGVQYCRVLHFIPEFGASFYVGKYISKKSLDWDFDYRGALAVQNPNDLFDYKVTSPFQGWRKFETVGKQAPKEKPQIERGGGLLGLPSKQSHQLEPPRLALECLQENQVNNARRRKKLQALSIAKQ